MIRTFTAQFGEGLKPNQFMENRLWRGSVTIISLQCNEIENSCAALLYGAALYAQKQADQQNAAAGAKSDF